MLTHPERNEIIYAGYINEARQWAHDYTPTEAFQKAFDTPKSAEFMGALSYALIERWSQDTEKITPGTQPISYLFIDQEISKLLDLLDDKYVKAERPWELKNMLMEIWQEVQFRRCGNRYYEVSDGLAQKLRHTVLRGLTTDDLKLPYSSVYIEVPPITKLEIHNSEIGRQSLEGIYILEDPAVHPRVFPWLPGWEPVHPIKEPVRVWQFMLWSKGLSNLTNDLRDALFHFQIELPPGIPLDEYMEQKAELARTHMKPASIRSQETIDWMVSAWQDIFTWAMNVILYATMPDAVLTPFIPDKSARKVQEKIDKEKEEEKKKILNKRLNEMRPKRVILLGKGMTTLDHDATRSGHPLTVRTLVEGHHQHYWVGHKESKERIRKYKEPFWRGPLDAPESPHTHRLIQ